MGFNSASGSCRQLISVRDFKKRLTSKFDRNKLKFQKYQLPNAGMLPWCRGFTQQRFISVSQSFNPAGKKTKVHFPKYIFTFVFTSYIMRIWNNNFIRNIYCYQLQKSKFSFLLEIFLFCNWCWLLAPSFFAISTRFTVLCFWSLL